MLEKAAAMHRMPPRRRRSATLKEVSCLREGGREVPRWWQKRGLSGMFGEREEANAPMDDDQAGEDEVDPEGACPNPYICNIDRQFAE